MFPEYKLWKGWWQSEWREVDKNLQTAGGIPLGLGYNQLPLNQDNSSTRTLPRDLRTYSRVQFPLSADSGTAKRNKHTSAHRVV